MKRAISIVLLLIMALSLVACGGNGSSGKKLTPADMKDIDTGKIYSLGDPKTKFDKEFGSLGTEEDEDTVDYLNGMLSVTYSDDDTAINISADGATNRFEFYNFSFDLGMDSIAGRYQANEVTGYTFYSRFYDAKGNSVDQFEATVGHSLMVKNGDLDILGEKDGDYLNYSIYSMDPSQYE